ncbi:MAG: hypothetical protein IT428_00545 [Planctomycetaceae bacterium]|nr:hypothetical protein [Planctomycetaceae bacterium]
MTPLVSPIESGDLSTNRWYHVLYGPRWGRYFESLKTQMLARGPVPVDIWDDSEVDIARSIESILAEFCWGEPIQFHPDDPWWVIGEWEIGDYSEVEAHLEIEKHFDISLPDEIMREFFARRGTFRDFVGMIASRRRSAVTQGS